MLMLGGPFLPSYTLSTWCLLRPLLWACHYSTKCSCSNRWLLSREVPSNRYCLRIGVAEEATVAQQFDGGCIAHLACPGGCLVVGLPLPLGGCSVVLSGCAHEASSPAPLTLPGVALQPGKAATGSPDALKLPATQAVQTVTGLLGMTALEMQ